MKTRFIAVVVLASLLLVSAPIGLALPAGSASSQRATSSEHSCCPGIHSSLNLSFVRIAPASVPCEQLPCCVKRAPGNPSALPGVTRVLRPDLNGNALARTEPATPNDSFAGAVFEMAFAPPFFVRSTVLRI